MLKRASPNHGLTQAGCACIVSEKKAVSAAESQPEAGRIARTNFPPFRHHPPYSLIPGFSGPFAAAPGLPRWFRLFSGASSVAILALGPQENRDRLRLPPYPWFRGLAGLSRWFRVFRLFSGASSVVIVALGS